MREIKFKVWLPSIKKMTYPLSITDWANGYEEIAFSGKETWLQFTGLKDKFGKEIYEGDVIQSWYSRDTSGKDIVTMIEPVEHIVSYETSGFSIPFIDNAEVIGNIYEHHGLISTTK